MKTITASNFRRYWAIFGRLFWTVFLIIVAAMSYGLFSGGDEVFSFRNEKLFMVAMVQIGGALLLAAVSAYKLLFMIFGRVFIFEDILRDKEIKVVTRTDDDGNNVRETYYYYLYFEQIFGKYAKRTEVTEKAYYSAIVGNKYYIGIINGKQSNRIYSADRYVLSEAAKRDLISDARELEKHTPWRWRAPEELPVKNREGTREITPEQIVRDMYAYSEVPKERKKSLHFVVACVVAMMALALVAPYVLKNGDSLGLFSFMTSILVVELLPFLLVIAFIASVTRLFSTRNIRKNKKEILARHYRVVKEVVEDTENYGISEFQYRNVHALMPVKLSSGRTISLNRANFNDVQPGDRLYVVYLESNNLLDDNSIVAVYQEKLGKLDFGFEVEWAS